MFTGIVERRATVVAVRKGAGGGQRLELEAETEAELPAWAPADVGESIAISGVCLTVVESEGRRLAFDVVPETLRLTTLGRLVPGDPANIERALAVGERFGGHFVTGHVDGMGTVIERRAEGDQDLFRIRTEPRLIRETLQKGSIAVDGISLTVIEVDRLANWFSFAAIPHTLKVTTLGTCAEGDGVNLETDAYGKWVLHGLQEIFAGEEAPDREAWRGMV